MRHGVAACPARIAASCGENAGLLLASLLDRETNERRLRTMLRSLNAMLGYRLAATDGEIGRCHDFLFDDRQWVIRYMVADTRAWLPGRKVLVSPVALGTPDWMSAEFPVDLTREQIRKSPALDTDAPVSKQHELSALEYFGWAHYWTGPYRWGPAVSPAMLRKTRRERSAAKKIDPTLQPELRSLKEVTGYHVSATDGELGKIDDLIVDEQCWAISHVVVRTRPVLPHSRVIFSAQWLDAVDWAQRTAKIHLTRAQIREAPEYDPTAAVNEELVPRAYDFHGRPIVGSASPPRPERSSREPARDASHGRGAP
jgi:hypothetical protein